MSQLARMMGLTEDPDAVATALTSFQGVDYELGHAPTLVVGGSWNDQLGRKFTCDPLLWSRLAEERADLKALLQQCKITRDNAEMSTTLTVTAPNLATAKMLASSLIRVKVVDLEPADSNNEGRVIAHHLRVGRDLVLLSREADHVNENITTSMIDDQNPELADGVTAIVVEFYNCKVGHMNVKHIVTPKLKGQEPVGDKRS